MLCRNNKDRFYRFYRFFKKERENNYRTLREIILPAGPLCGDVSACGIVALRRPLRRFSHAVRTRDFLAFWKLISSAAFVPRPH